MNQPALLAPPVADFAFISIWSAEERISLSNMLRSFIIVVSELEFGSLGRGRLVNTMLVDLEIWTIFATLDELLFDMIRVDRAYYKARWSVERHPSRRRNLCWHGFAIYFHEIGTVVIAMQSNYCSTLQEFQQGAHVHVVCSLSDKLWVYIG